MPARNIKTYIAAVAAAAAVGLGAPALASAGFIAAPASAPASGPGGDASQAPMPDVHLTQHTPRDDPHTYRNDGTQPAVLCATAIEYGLIAA
jgi:predicted component of type VI protein secretion system